jgi:hypothetical protein
MSKVETAISNLADGFCKIGQGKEQRDLYVKALESLIRMAISEHDLACDLDYARCMGIVKGNGEES